ncbi:alpha-2-macroglobulin family protein [uncultured Kordia sp.]|uniref:alpha-2-macroglobulin family protein n=1 Tax=uncultured Kordia sp. TaxID=507699 RepID=UPI00260C23AF|nr:alpha-2-macroglobulin family protein [uncultured Kordia sp.]
MQKIYILSLFTFLCVQLSVAQYNYDKKWKKVENFEIQGKLSSANRIVKHIYKNAEKDQNTAQIVKSFIHLTKFSLLITEASEETVLENLKKEIDRQSFPTNAILENMYARFLAQYFSKYEYKIRQRSILASDVIPDDIQLWTTKMFITEIHKHFQHSITEEKALLQLPVEDYMVLLDGKANTKKYRSSLYDILVYNMLEFYKREIPYSYRRNRTQFSSKDFAQTDEFIKQNFEFNKKEAVSRSNVLYLFQKLERIYKGKKEAYVDIVIQRFKYILEESMDQKYSVDYIKGLKQLAQKYTNDPLEALIQYEIADQYLVMSQSYLYKSNKEHSEYRTRALAITKKMTATYPNSEGGIKCKLLQKKIEQKTIRFKAETYSIPNKPSLLQVRVRNVDTLFLKAYRISHTFANNVGYMKRDSIIGDFLKKRKETYQQLYISKIPKDYYEHTTEISLAPLPKGRYLITLSDNPKGEVDTDVLAYDFIQKTNLTAAITEFENEDMHTIVDRSTGKPIYNATVHIFNKDKSINQKERTNVYGNATINKREKIKSIQKYITFENDTLFDDRTYLYGAQNYDINDSKEDIPIYAKPFVFMDRSIYRPGQTAYFKVILLQEKNDVSSVVPNVVLPISIVSDAGDEIKRLRLKTNEFGAISGSFVIPKNAGTGEFTLNVEEDYDFEEDEHPFWDAIESFYEYEHEFQVEEYKRPRFEVTLNPLTKNIYFNDSVQITGNAKALLGSPITDGKVSYTIQRTVSAYFDSDAMRKKYQKPVILIDSVSTTDAEGNFSISFVAKTHEEIPLDKIFDYKYTLNIEITDINGETQTAEKSIIINRESFRLYTDIPTKNERANPLKVTLSARDINNVPYTTTGKVTIHKLKKDARVFRKRPWNTPGTQIISKADFIKQFPHISYNDEEEKEANEKALEVANAVFQTENNNTFTFDTSTWESGKYIIESKAYDEKQEDSIVSKETFIITDKTDLYLADNELFDYEVLNSNYKDDGFIQLKLATALRNETLNVLLHKFYQGKLLSSQLVSIDKGSKIVRVPVDQKHTDQYTIRMSFTKFNSFYEDDFSFKLYEKNQFLTIVTETFRNKLIPGQKEIWRFKILDLEQNPSNAEILASMYDESLDQFKSHFWDPNQDHYGGSSYDIPRMNSYHFKVTNSKQFYNMTNQVFMPVFKNYLKLDEFGLDFNDVTNANYRYIDKLVKQKKRKNKAIALGNISGHILDESGLPLPGATVLIKGTERGTTTDFDGLYTIDASSDDVLSISYVGFETQEIPVGLRNDINVQLEAGEGLESVMIVASGISRKRTKTGITVSVNGVSMNTVPTGTLDQMLRSMPGVNANTASGFSGQSTSIIIRGRGTLNTDTEPLFVIDGVPVDQNEFRNLSDKNIVSLSVLKDAAATALYGSRGAGGVVLVTTKYGTRKEIIDGVHVIVGVTEEDLDTIETRKNLQETAFFYPHLRTDAQGIVAVEFEAPESLTRWKFQLFAHQKNGMFQTLSKNAVTQKELMVVPNMPRFLREKDTIVISTKVVNLQEKASKGIASLRLFDATTMESIDTKVHLTEKNKSFTLDAKGNTNLSWKLYIPEGIDAIQYKVIATAEQFSDGEESVLPVLKNSLLITEAKPIMVKAGEQKEIRFEKLANTTSESLTQHQLTLEYTSNPTWSAIQSLPYLIEYPYECAEQTSSRLYANMLAAHILQSSPKVQEVFEAWKANGELIADLEKNPELKSLLISETPWVRDAASQTQQKQQLAKLFDSKALEEMQKEMWYKLNELQTESGGFPWFAGGRENYYITLHILQTFAQLVKLNIITKDSETIYYENIMEAAYKYADERFLIAHADLVKEPNDAKYRRQINYLYTRSMVPDFIKIPPKVEKAMNFYLETLRKNWMLTSIEDKAMIALSLARMGKRKDAKKIMEALEESAVKTSENGMYWKEITERRYYNASAIETQALLIEAFAEIIKDEKMVQELQLWLLQQKQYNRWETTKATTKAVYALLLNPKQFVSIKDNTSFTIGTEKISTKKLAETAKEAGTGYFKTSWKKDEVTSDKAIIKIKNNGKTAGFGAVYWQYFEELDKVTQSEDGTLQVSKELYLKETRSGEEILVPIDAKQLKVGDKITVHLIIRNKKDVEFIHLKDMRAAGLEPINVLSEYKWQDGIGYYESTRDASTNFFFDRIPKGVFILEYDVRVNNSGEFSNGITTIESMYAPQLRSHTKGIRIKVF